MVESNKKPLYEENEGHKNDTGTCCAMFNNCFLTNHKFV